MTLIYPPLTVPTQFVTLGCHCGNFGQEVGRQPSCIMVNGERFLDGLWLGDRPPRALRRIERSLDQGRNSAESEPPADEFTAPRSRLPH